MRSERFALVAEAIAARLQLGGTRSVQPALSRVICISSASPVLLEGLPNRPRCTYPPPPSIQLRRVAT